MPQPAPYNPSTDFSAEEANNLGGRSTVRTAQLDAEFANLAATIAAIRANLALIQRDDGNLADGTVELHTLANDVVSLLATTGCTVRGAWAGSTAYAAKDIVTESGSTYICAVAHTSGVFATDLAAVRWIALAPLNSPTLLGDPKAPTPANHDDDTSIATTAFVQNKSRIAPTVQQFTSGSGTYVTPANVKWIRVQMVGGGGGGGGGGSAAGVGGSGGTTTFGTGLLSATGGNGGNIPGNYPATGGAGTISAPAVGMTVAGGTSIFGGGGTTGPGGQGGGTPFCTMGGGSASGAAGIAGPANSGAGGGGGGANGAGAGGNGGAGGGYVDAIIANPSATYAYSVGAAGTAGAAGGSGTLGGAGAAGRIVVWEFY